MGHSYVDLGDQGVWLNDGSLTLRRHFIQAEGQRLLDERNAPLPLRQSFQVLLEGFVDYGPGVFLVNFRPTIEGEQGQLEFLMGVFDRVANGVARFLRHHSAGVPGAAYQHAGKLLHS